jgi:hypothetical protein
MSKNATDEQLRAKMSQVVGNAGAPEHDFADWGGLKRKARAAFGAGGADAFEEDGIMAPDLLNLAEATRKRRKGNTDSEPEGGEEQPEEEGHSDDEEERKEKGTKKGWFDAETQISKAEERLRQADKRHQGHHDRYC